MQELPTRRSLRERPAAPDAASGDPGRRAGDGGPLRGVLHAIGVGLSAGLLLITLGLALIVVVLPIAVGGTAYTVLTGSMQPHLPPGTFIVVKPTPAADIRIGDVVTYQLESGRPEVVTHRVVQRTIDATTGEVTLVTQGDANNTPDARPVREVQLRGKVWYAVPYIGWVNNVLNGESRAWIVPLVAGLLLAYAAWMLVAGIRERRRTRAAAAAAAAASEG